MNKEIKEIKIYNVGVVVTNEDLDILEEVFEHEDSQKPVSRMDRFLIRLMKQVKDNPRVEVTESEAVVIVPKGELD